MLLPRFSIRSILAAVAVFSVLSLIASMAVRGAPWAIAAAIGIGGLALTFVFFFLFFAAGFLISSLLKRRDRHTPFTDQPSRQVLPTTDLD